MNNVHKDDDRRYGYCRRDSRLKEEELEVRSLQDHHAQAARNCNCSPQRDWFSNLIEAPRAGIVTGPGAKPLACPTQNRAS